MSDVQPPTPPSQPPAGPPTEPIPAVAESQPTSNRRTAVIAGVSVATLAVVAGGAYAAMNVLGGSDGAEKAMPADTIAVVSIDLDPGAKQKIEAIKTLRKFPQFRKDAKIDSGDDLREKFFDEALKDSDCKGKVTYAKDIEPWIGENAAFGAIPDGSKKASPLVALAITDQDKAQKGLDALLACTDSKDDAGFAFTDGFVLISDSTSHAKAAATSAEKGSLADDAGYKKWSGAAGDRGVVNFYVAKSAATYAADNADALDDITGPGDLPTDFPTDLPSDFPTDLPSDFPTDLPSDFPTDLPSDFPSDLPSGDTEPTVNPAAYVGEAVGQPAATSDDGDEVKKALADFEGAAGALRFADGGMELSAVAGGLGGKAISADTAGKLVRDLPKDTTAAIGISVPEGYAKSIVDGIDGLSIPLLGSGSDLTDSAEQQLGITLPDDLVDLLGQGLAVSVGGTPPKDLAQVGGPDDIPAGLTIKGDPDKIVAVVDKITAAIGASSDDITVKKGDGKVTLAFDSDYAAELAKSGDLSGSSSFTDVVPESDKAASVVYLDFNTKWREAIADTMSGSEKSDFLANTEPLKAIGISAWKDGDLTRMLVKVTTD